MIFESNSDRLATFLITMVVMPPFMFLAYWALRKSRELPRSMKWRVRISAFALFMMGVVFVCWGFINLMAMIVS